MSKVSYRGVVNFGHYKGEHYRFIFRYSNKYDENWYLSQDGLWFKEEHISFE